MISIEEIAQLAQLFDRYNNALDPLSEDCLLAKHHFDELVGRLHAAQAPDIQFSGFRYELVRQCRDYLRKNRP